jgi:hypothetical protein|tara:strand:+ start:443 stop:604 length:162 start_codon:yes stop_codon:yes gene_type:complete
VEDMSKLRYLSKDKSQRMQQIALILHNCNVYGIKKDKELIDEYEKLEKELNKK